MYSYLYSPLFSKPREGKRNPFSLCYVLVTYVWLLGLFHLLGNTDGPVPYWDLRSLSGNLGSSRLEISVSSPETRLVARTRLVATETIERESTIPRVQRVIRATVNPQKELRPQLALQVVGQPANDHRSLWVHRLAALKADRPWFTLRPSFRGAAHRHCQSRPVQHPSPAPQE